MNIVFPQKGIQPFMNKVLRAAIRTMSRHQGDMTKDYEKSRKKEKMYPYYKGRSCNTMDRILHLEGRDILLRTYSYDGKVAPLILFFHGGGFVTGDFESYGNVCANLSERTGYKVVSVNHAAFLRSMHQHGLKTSPAAIGCSYYLSECMEKHLPRFLENGITAIICNQDTLASATLTQCQQLGFQVPDDISIIGFDDLPIAACTSPPLTTIRQDRLELGKSGFFALSSLLNHIPISTYLLHAQLIQRESTRKIPL